VVLVATWVAGEIAESQERDTVDTRLAANLRVGREEFADALREAETRAERVAASQRVQRALAEEDAAAARRIAETEGGIGLIAGDRLLAGDDSWAASRAVDVIGDDGETVGRVVAGVPLDDALAERLARSAGLLDMDALAISDDGELLASSGPLPEGATIPAGEEGTTEQGGESYRFVSTPLLEGTGIGLTALSSEAPVAEAVDDTRRRAFFAALATVGLALLIALTVALFQRRRAAGARGTSGAAVPASSGFARPWPSSGRRSPRPTTRRRCCR
jgi:hypothetical protein